MKFNWGTGIAITIAIFIVFIISMIIRVSGENIELVTEDYYPRELKYQEEIEAYRNANALQEKIAIEMMENRLLVKYPKNWERDSIKGNLHIYRPSDKSLDRNIKILPDSLNIHTINIEELINGKYLVNIDILYLNKNYKLKQDLVIY